ncbi:HlyD family secretion protein [Bordetella sp. 15P40C-2]|uniref:HlyD family secretion protein n=1 Tax=Bordetella sp. 15P40C-2 TaxID=2572246 RepID=UPI001365B6D8|nr:HlyD family efflux transporter periplasmic adaptor subunit [Bordetella sp. 15P40C-2]
MLAIFTLGSFTQRVTVMGRLMPEGGIAKVTSPISGTIKEKRFLDGQRVAAGDTLYVVSGERHDANGEATSTALIKHISDRREHLMQDLLALDQSHDRQLRHWRQRLSAQLREIEKYGELIAEHRKLVELTRTSASRYARLRSLAAASAHEADSAQIALHEETSRLHALERDLLLATQARDETEHTLADLPSKHQRETTRLRNELSELSQQLVEHTSAREVAVVSPISGTATAVVANVGEHVVPTKLLVSIVPDDQALEAHLYVQSHAVGRLMPDALVRLRYHAFPYQEYGLHTGHVMSVSETAVPQEELSDIHLYREGAGVPLYLVKVRPALQSVHGSKGETHRLKAGMLLEASLERETRRLYEWAFVPLHRVRDKL